LQLILSMERIKGVIDIDPVDGVIQAWAGTRLSDLNQALAPHGLCFPSTWGPTLGGRHAGRQHRWRASDPLWRCAPQHAGPASTADAAAR
jgi:FAD/FMN-containing dehydrogenase